MKRFFIVLFAFLICSALVACSSEVSTKETIETPNESKESKTPEKPTLPEPYQEILEQYKEIIEIWQLDGKTKDNMYFNEIIENAAYPKPYGSDAKNVHWAAMIAVSWYPKTAKYGYILKDINADGVPEMFWVRDDYSLLAAFTITEGKAITLGAYYYRSNGFVMDSGRIMIHGSGGADAGGYILYELPQGGKELVLIKMIGYDCTYDKEEYTEYVDGQEQIIEKAVFDEYMELYFPTTTTTENWKNNEIIFVG